MTNSLSGRNPADQGFAMMEALVALAIVTIGLTTFCQAAGFSYRTAARLKLHNAALTSTRSLLDQTAQGSSVSEGVSSGRFADDLAWRMTVSQIGSPQLTPVERETIRVYWIALETMDRRGSVLVKLETAKLVRAAP